MDKTREDLRRESETRNLKIHIEDARAGDVRISRYLLKEFIAIVKRGEAPPALLLEYFADCFSDYLNKYSGDNECWMNAMNTVAGPGQQINTDERDEMLLWDYAQHLNEGGTTAEFKRSISNFPPDYWSGPPPSESTVKRIISERKRKEQRKANAKKRQAGEWPTGKEIEAAQPLLPSYRSLSKLFSAVLDDTNKGED